MLTLLPIAFRDVAHDNDMEEAAGHNAIQRVTDPEDGLNRQSESDEEKDVKDVKD